MGGGRRCVPERGRGRRGARPGEGAQIHGQCRVRRAVRCHGLGRAPAPPRCGRGGGGAPPPSAGARRHGGRRRQRRHGRHLRRDHRARQRLLGRRQQVLDLRAVVPGAVVQAVEDQLVLVRHVHAAGLLRPQLGGRGVGFQQRRAAVGRHMVAAVRVEDDAGEGGDADHGGAKRQQPAPAPVRRRVAIGIGRVVDVALVLHHRISSTGSTPMTWRPDAITVAVACTMASRASVSSPSPSMRKRRLASSRPLFHSAWKSDARSYR